VRFFEVVARVNGFSTPIFGLQRTPPTANVSVQLFGPTRSSAAALMV